MPSSATSPSTSSRTSRLPGLRSRRARGQSPDDLMRAGAEDFEFERVAIGGVRLGLAGIRVDGISHQIASHGTNAPHATVVVDPRDLAALVVAHHAALHPAARFSSAHLLVARARFGERCDGIRLLADDQNHTRALAIALHVSHAGW